ncbi:major facilitator superfamily domain-containing protein 12 [Nematostella vectensis]|uniref:major facilitator superfamily domain-containing protein 12 n=1 Tax=Nematostella vectensis TaxID=45351 RepID=UPI00207763EC|nr:major facilitator superfamily domain-containing protein 12 [Nematostella vectensis]XP_032223122.2 major facilitator superfamily domain-containing protein 12 [Nematostella vectensis]
MKALVHKLCGERNNKLVKPDRTPLKQRFAYGVGHVFNDLCIQAWFSYSLIYFTKVMGLSAVNAGYIFLASQLADAFSTPFIGYLCDRQITKIVGERYGNKKIWHLFGCVGIAIVWPFLFSPCLMCDENTEEWQKTTYFGILTLIFNICWPMVEISHLSLMPHVARRTKDAIELSAIRSAMKLGCGVYVYVVTWILLKDNKETQIDASVQKPFTYQTIIVLITGGIFALVFHWGVDETTRHREMQNEKERKRSESIRQQEKEALKIRDPEKQALEDEYNHIEVIDRDAKKHMFVDEKKSIKEWFKSTDFYVMMVIYFTTQNTTNLIQTYFPIYLTETMHFPKEAIAYFPLLILVFGIIASAAVKPLTKKFSNRVLYCASAVVVIASEAWMFFNPQESRDAIYAPTILLGCGVSIMVVTSLAMVSDLIGDDKESSGVVYAVMSFVDKLSLGLIVLGLQENTPENHGGVCIPCMDYTRTAFAVIPGIEALIGFVAVAFFFQRSPLKNFNEKRREKEEEKRKNKVIEMKEDDCEKLKYLKSSDV